jgi:hypothetical protein
MVYLLYKGLEDTFLTENPDFTYFKTVYHRDAESLSMGYEIPFDNPKSEIMVCTIPRSGDYIQRMVLKVIVPQLTDKTTTYWTRDTTSLSGSMKGFDSSGNEVCTVNLIGNLAITDPLTGWVSTTGDIRVTAIDPISFQFCSNTPISYIVFNSMELATFWGFKYNPILLFGGYVKFLISTLYTSHIPSQVNANQFSTINVSVSNWFYANRTVYNVTYNGVNFGAVYIEFRDAQTFTFNGFSMTGGFASTSYDGTRLTLVPNQLSNGHVRPVITYDWNSTVPNYNLSYFYGYLTFHTYGFNYANCTASWSNSVFTVRNPSLFIQGGFVTITSTIPAYTDYTSTFSAQSTWQDSGWQLGNPYTSSNSYVDGVIENYVQVASLFIGGQVIQEMDPFYMRYVKESTYTYKNRPVLDLVENGDTNVVDSDRIYYYELPFICPLPIHALINQDVQVRIKLNPTNQQFVSTLIIHYDIFQDTLPVTYDIVVPQVSYFLQGLDVRGPMTKLITAQQEFTFRVNGETYCDTEYTLVSSYENDFNVPLHSNTCTVNGTIHMSRFRYQESVSNVYAETKNILGIAHGIAGLYYDTTQTRLWPVFSGSLNGPSPPPVIKYLFDVIPNSVSVMQCFFSVRLCNSRYNGPVLRLQANGIEADFYTDTKQSYLSTRDKISVSTWSGGNTIYVSTWYDQTYNANHIVQPVTQFRPTLVLGPDGITWVVSFSNQKQLNVTDSKTSATQWMQLTEPVESQQLIVSVYPKGGINPATAPDGTEEKSCVLSTINGIGIPFSTSVLYLSYGTYEASDLTWFNPSKNVVWYNVNGTVDGFKGANLPNTTRKVVNENWGTLLTWGVDAPPIPGDPFNFIGTQGQNILISRSYNGYISEISFLEGSTLSQEYKKYYPLFQ